MNVIQGMRVEYMTLLFNLRSFEQLNMTSSLWKFIWAMLFVEKLENVIIMAEHISIGIWRIGMEQMKLTLILEV